jgi:hypothetical protein
MKNDILQQKIHRLVDPFTSTTLPWTRGPPGAEKQRKKRPSLAYLIISAAHITHVEYYVSIKCLATLYTCLTIRSSIFVTRRGFVTFVIPFIVTTYVTILETTFVS